jgi:adenylate cyclase
MAHAQINYAMSLWEVEDYELALQKALEWAQRSLDLDANDARCHGALGQAHFAMKQFDLAEFHIARARSLNPCDPDVIALQCYLAAYSDHPERAIPLVELAQDLSPLQPNWYYEPWGVALYQLGRYAEAADVFERALASQPYALRYLAACYAQLGETAKAKVIADKSMKLQPDFSLQKWQMYEQYRSRAGLQHMLDGLRKAGLPE